MTVASLLKAMNNTVVDEKKKKALVARLKAADDKFEVNSRKKMVTEEFLSRACSL